MTPASSEIIPLVSSVSICAMVRPLSARQTIIGSSYLEAIVAFEGWREGGRGAECKRSGCSGTHWWSQSILTSCYVSPVVLLQ